MPGEGAEERSRGHLPELDRFVPGPRGEGLPVRGERDRSDAVCMPGEGAEDLRTLHGDQQHPFIVAGPYANCVDPVLREAELVVKGERDPLLGVEGKDLLLDPDPLHLEPYDPCAPLQSLVRKLDPELGPLADPQG